MYWEMCVLGTRFIKVKANAATLLKQNCNMNVFFETFFQGSYFLELLQAFASRDYLVFDRKNLMYNLSELVTRSSTIRAA